MGDHCPIHLRPKRHAVHLHLSVHQCIQRLQLCLAIHHWLRQDHCSIYLHHSPKRHAVHLHLSSIHHCQINGITTTKREAETKVLTLGPSCTSQMGPDKISNVTNIL